MHVKSVCFALTFPLITLAIDPSPLQGHPLSQYEFGCSCTFRPSVLDMISFIFTPNNLSVNYQ